jgi:hypothetical protein
MLFHIQTTKLTLKSGILHVQDTMAFQFLAKEFTGVSFIHIRTTMK